MEAVRGAAGTIGYRRVSSPSYWLRWRRSGPKINPVLWVREGKGTLALGNITGAMVFQSTIPVTFGVLFTSLELGPLNLFSAALALASGGFIYAVLRRDATPHSRHLMIGGVFYLALLIAAVFAVT